MSWVRRHLNWFFVLSVLFYWFLCVVLGFIVGFLGIYADDSFLDLVVYLLGFIILFPVSLYILSAKGRSLWWVLLAGWLSPLWLTNKKRKEQQPEDTVE
jgi:H+/Cl- antiporter ClcA